MYRRKRISPIVWTIGILVVLVIATFVIARLDFPGRILRALAGIVPSSGQTGQPVADEEEMRGRLRELEGENAILRETLLQLQGEQRIEALEGDIGYPILAAKVIYRDHSRLFDTALIDRGSSDGVETDMPVVDSGGLVGRVVAVRAEVSRIVLVTSPDCAVGVRDQRSRELGIVRGSELVRWWADGNGENDTVASAPDLLELSYLSPSAEIRTNDTLVTSGLSGITPPGIRVGEVQSIISHEEQGRFEIHVRPFADLEHLESVGVVLYREDDRIELDELLEEVDDEAGPPEE